MWSAECSRVVTGNYRLEQWECERSPGVNNRCMAFPVQPYMRDRFKH
jgi:hypothetical protein